MAHYLALVKIVADNLVEALRFLRAEFEYARKKGIDYYTILAIVQMIEPGHFERAVIELLEKKFLEWHHQSIEETERRLKENSAMRDYYEEKLWFLKAYKWTAGSHYITICCSKEYPFDSEDSKLSEKELEKRWKKLFYFIIDYHV